MTVLPMFWTVMRKTTLLPTGTGVLVGLNKIFVTVNAGLLTCNLAEEVLVTEPPLAVAKFVTAPDPNGGKGDSNVRALTGYERTKVGPSQEHRLQRCWARGSRRNSSIERM